MTRAYIGSVLEEAGHEVTVTADGVEAWTAFERDPIDMAILDWVMPELDGIDVLRRIRAGSVRNDCFVVMVTSRGTTRDVMEALNAGADDFVAKPVSSEHLRARLLIAERRIQQSAAARRMEDSLRRAQWLAGIGETVLTVQHEINNPLAVLLMETTNLSQQPQLPPELGRSLGILLEQVTRIADVVRKLGSLRDPKTVEAMKGLRMLDLSASADDPERAR